MNTLPSIWVQVLGAVALAATLSIPVAAGNSNDPTTLYLDQRYTASPVDWQTWCGDCVGPGQGDFTINEPWTVNPGWVPGYMPPIVVEASGGGSDKDSGCLFDSDDWFEYHTTGNTFTANTTLIATECRWRGVVRSDGGGSLLYLRFQSASPNLVITVKWDWGAGAATIIIPATPASGSLWTYGYGTCWVAPIASGGMVIPVPGSHDGSAIWEVITVTISNPTSRKTSKTGGFIGSDFRDNGLWCPNGWIEV